MLFAFRDYFRSLLEPVLNDFFEIETSLKHLFLILLLDRFARLHTCNWLAIFIFTTGHDLDLYTQIHIAKVLSLAGFHTGIVLNVVSQIRLWSLGILLFHSFSKILACICCSAAHQVLVLRNNWATWTILTLASLAHTYRWPLTPSLGWVILGSLHR